MLTLHFLWSSPYSSFSKMKINCLLLILNINYQKHINFPMLMIFRSVSKTKPVNVCESGKASSSKGITCLSSSSLLAVRQVTRCLVRLRKEPRTSRERCSRDDRCSMKLITRKPRFWIMCCWTVDELSTSSQMKPSSFELSTQTC